MATARASSAPRRRGKSIRWDRVGRTALLLVLGVIVLLYIPPAMRWVEQRETADRQSAEVEQLQREHEELQARLEGLHGRDAVEREARRLGMVRLGERPIVIEGLPEQP